MLRWQRVIHQQHAARIHHVSHAGHRHGLLKQVVIHQHVGGDYQIKSLAWRLIHGLGHYVQIDGGKPRSVLRLNGDGARGNRFQAGW